MIPCKKGQRTAIGDIILTVEGIKASIRQASDMMADGTQNPAVQCTGISVGLGFTAQEVGNPTKVTPKSSSTNAVTTVAVGTMSLGKYTLVISPRSATKLLLDWVSA